MTLNELASQFGTDKRENMHDYARFYDQHFSHLKDESFNLLEIGVSTGRSLLMWEKYFKKATIYGIDNDLKWIRSDKDRIKVLFGDQLDFKFLDQLIKDVNEFTIIIDDGGHLMEQQIATFEHMFPLLSNKGIYVIEDLQTSYIQGYNKKYKDLTTIEFLKNRIEDIELNGKRVNNAHLSGRFKIDILKKDSVSMNYYEEHIDGICFYNDICFILKR